MAIKQLGARGASRFDTDVVPAKALFDPISPIPWSTAHGLTITAAVSTTALTYTSVVTHYWNTAETFNTQTQNWQEDTVATPANGCRNRITLRTITGTAYGAVTDFETIIMADKLGIVYRPHGACDLNVYIKRASDPVMHRLSLRPIDGGSSGTQRLNLTLPDKDLWQIKFVGANARFVGIECEASAIIKPAPNRPVMPVDGDSWVERLDALISGSDETYYSYGICDALFEATGFAIPRLGQGGSGYFQPGTGVTQTDYTYMTQYNSSIFFSNDRKGIAGATTGQAGRDDPAGTWGWNMFLDDPWCILGFVHGTFNDGSHSGATGLAGGPMSLRVQECMDWIRTQNKNVRMIQVTPEPYDNWAAASVHDLNRQEHIHAMAAAPNAAELSSSSTFPLPGLSRGCIDASNPTKRWVDGTGSDNSPATDKQAQLIGGDGLHNSYKGQRFWGGMYAKAIGEFLVPANGPWMG